MKKPRRPRRSRAKGALPKGAHRLPSGDIALRPQVSTMPNGRRLMVQGIRRAEPDLKRLAQALVQQAIDQADQDTLPN